MPYTTRPVITGKKAVISAGHYLATQAGARMLAAGGNAIDAGVAAGFALAVVKPEQNGMGGECPILVYSPKAGRVFAISGQGCAPGAAAVEWFERNRIKAIPDDGFLGATVPGMFGSYCMALSEFGTMTLEQVLEPAIELAEGGFPVHAALSGAVKGCEARYKAEWPTSYEVFCPGGKAPEPSAILNLKALANTLKRLSDASRHHAGLGRRESIAKAVDFFYRGEIARDILDYAKHNPVRDGTGERHASLLELSDFERYATRLESPVQAAYRNFSVYKCGPWTQGPVFLQQLKLLEGFDLKSMRHNSAEYVHLVAECAKLAFADRERYYGDPDFSDVPLGALLSEEYNRMRRERIDRSRACLDPVWEEPANPVPVTRPGDTTHLDAVDSDGWMISATPSGGWIPSSPVIPKLGFPLGTRAQVFNFRRGHPNCIQPYKRPRTTLTPSLAFRDGKPWIVFGTPGGDMQDQWTLQFFLNIADFGMDLQQAIDEPVVHIRHFPNSFYPHEVYHGVLYAEPGIGRAVLDELGSMGHIVECSQPNAAGSVSGVRIDDDRHVIEGAASSKGDGQAYAFGW